MSQYPWTEIREKYETGKYTMKDLSEEYGFNENYGHQKANKNDWVKGKSKEKINREAAKKVKENEVDKEAKLRKEYDKIINNIRRDTANELFKRDTDFDRLKQLKIGSQIIHNCRVEQWEVAKILEISEQVEANDETSNLAELVGAVENAPVKDEN